MVDDLASDWHTAYYAITLTTCSPAHVLTIRTAQLLTRIVYAYAYLE